MALAAASKPVLTTRKSARVAKAGLRSANARESRLMPMAQMRGRLVGEGLDGLMTKAGWDRTDILRGATVLFKIEVCISILKCSRPDAVPSGPAQKRPNPYLASCGAFPDTAAPRLACPLRNTLTYSKRTIMTFSASDLARSAGARFRQALADEQ